MDCNVLASDQRIVTNPWRITHRNALEAKFIETFAKKPSEKSLNLLQVAGVPCVPIHTIGQALTLHQARARGVGVQLANPDATAGKVCFLGNPLKSSKTPVKYAKAPPWFGADTGSRATILARHNGKRNTAD